MKVPCVLLPLALAQLVSANPTATSDDDDDNMAGTAVANLKRMESDLRNTNRQNNSPEKVFGTPTVFSKPKLPNVMLPNHPGVISIPHPQFVPMPHHQVFTIPHRQVVPIPHHQVVAIPHHQLVTIPHPYGYFAHPVVPVVPKVHDMDDQEEHQLEVLQLSNGLQVVPLDDDFGRVIDYIYLGREINLVPGPDGFYLPATDPVDGHTTYVNLGTESGHLTLSKTKIGNTIQQGFEGVDENGPVFVPVMRRFQRIVVNPVVYRRNKHSYY